MEILTDVYSEQFQIQHDENNSASQILLTSSISMLFRRGMTSWWRHITDIPQGPRSYFIQMTWFISEFIDGVNINLITWWLRPITWPQIQVQHFRLEWHAKQIHTGTTYKHPLILIHEFNFFLSQNVLSIFTVNVLYISDIPMVYMSLNMGML